MKTNNTLKPIRQISLLFLAALAIFGLSYLIFAVAFKSNVYFDMGEKGAHLGDSMGVLNSFFSVLAFLGVALSLYYQRKAMAKQEEELQLARNMYVKTGFETTLNGLIESMQLHINDTRGKFPHLATIKEKTGAEYYSALYDDVRTIHRALRLNVDGSKPLTWSILSYYKLSLPSEANEQTQKIISESIQDFSRNIILATDDIHRKEYFNAWQVYSIIMDALRKEYELWITAKFWSVEETNRIFSIYVNLVKSRIPYGAQFYFLYLKKLDSVESCNDFIYQLFYKESPTANFLEARHYEILFGEKKETVPIG